jgi:Beta-propeller repeat
VFKRVTIVGQTSSTDFSTRHLAQPIFGGITDGYVATLNDSDSQMVFSTYLGSSSVDQASGVGTDLFGNLYVTGIAEAADFPTVNPLQPDFGGVADAFITKIYNPFEAKDGCV